MYKPNSKLKVLYDELLKLVPMDDKKEAIVLLTIILYAVVEDFFDYLVNAGEIKK